MMTEYTNMLTAIKRKPKRQQLNAVFVFFISRITHMPDLVVHGVSDFWQPLKQTLRLKTGDCEDFAIAWYFTLRLFGFNCWIEHWHLQGTGSHMVCCVKCGGKVWVLDNMSSVVYLRSSNKLAKTNYRLTEQTLLVGNHTFSSQKIKRWAGVLNQLDSTKGIA